MKLNMLEATDRRDVRKRRLVFLGVALGLLGLAGFLGMGGSSLLTRDRDELPLALIVLALSALPLAACLWTVLRSWRVRVPEGRCQDCGYELQPSQSRCPECGFVRSERAGDAASSPPQSARVRTVVQLAVDVVAVLPLYGYVVLANREPQLVAAFIALLWLIAIGGGFATLVVAVLRPPVSRAGRILAAASLVHLWLMASLGAGGVANAVRELLA